jgi:flagellar hook-associated protein 2
MPGVDGIVSGLDTSSMINAIVGVAAVPKRVMETHLSEMKKKREAIAALSTRFTAVSDAIKKIDTKEEFEATSLTQLDDTQFTANIEEGAKPGIYDIQVTSLAVNEVEVSQAFSDKATTGQVREGTYAITYGSTTTNITIDSASSSWEKLAEKINDVTGVTSYVLDTGETTNQFRLMVQGQDTGAANSISISGPASGAGTLPTFTEQVAAGDAKVEVNGIQISSDKNAISGAVPGVNMDLWETGTAASRVTIATDDDTMADLVETVVTAYNNVNSYFETYSAFNSDENIKAPLVGESGASRAVDGLGQVISGNYSLTGDLEALSQIGVKTERDGSLSFDKDKFKTILNSNYDDVIELITSDDGPMGKMKSQIDDLYVDSESGVLSTRRESLESSITATEDDIADFETYLSDYEQRLRTKFTNMELTLGRLQSTQGSLSALMAGLYSSG